MIERFPEAWAQFQMQVGGLLRPTLSSTQLKPAILRAYRQVSLAARCRNACSRSASS